jgi:DNA-binding response OmpR family regulator
VLARRHLPDVVLSDVVMPGTDGHELVRVLRASAETDFLSIILLTAQAEDQQRLEGLERGADEYIVKPFEMRELGLLAALGSRASRPCGPADRSAAR